MKPMADGLAADFATRLEGEKRAREDFRHLVIPRELVEQVIKTMTEREDQIRRQVCEWIKDDLPISVKMTLDPRHIGKLVRRLVHRISDGESAAKEDQ